MSKIRTNWKQVSLELEVWKIPDDVVDDLIGTGNVGHFRNECRKYKVSEDAIDYAIKMYED
jgi:hypothetical protein